jgi:hypothetical protein
MRIRSPFEQAGIVFLDDQARGGTGGGLGQGLERGQVLFLRNEAKFIGSSLNSFSRQGDVNDDDLYVRRGLELAGGGFIDENGGGPGVPRSATALWPLMRY